MAESWQNRLVIIASANTEMIRFYFPLYLVWTVGLFLAWRHRRLHPRIFRLVSVALVGWMLKFPLGTLAAAGMTEAARSFGWDRGPAMNGLVFAEILVEAALWGLVLTAIFSGRATGPRAAE